MLHRRICVDPIRIVMRSTKANTNTESGRTFGRTMGVLFREMSLDPKTQYGIIFGEERVCGRNKSGRNLRSKGASNHRKRGNWSFPPKTEKSRFREDSHK